MSIRMIPVWLLVLAFATEASAQNRIRWRPGQVAGGLVREIERVFSGAPAATDQELQEAPPVAPAIDGDDVSPRAEDGRPPAGARQPINLQQDFRRTFHPPLNDSTIPRRSGAVPSRAVSVTEVVKLVIGGLSESTIIRYIEDNGVKEALDVSDLLHLHEEGVSEPVIMALQNAAVVGDRYPVSRAHVPSKSPTGLMPEQVERTGKAVDHEYGASILAPPANLDLPPPPALPSPPQASNN